MSKGQWGVGYLAGTGLSLGTTTVSWFVLRRGAGFTAYVGTVTGIVLSLTLVYLAYWLTQSDLEGEHIWAVSRWGAVGLAIPTVPILATAVFGLASSLTVEPSVLTNIAAASSVIGALFGAVTALEREHGRVLELHQRNVVLNRVLRHDVRNDSGLLLVFAERLEEEFEAAGDELADPIREKADEIIELSRLARGIEDLHDADTIRPVEVTTIIEEQVRTVQHTHPDVDIETDLPEEAWVSATELLRTVIDNLIENAIEHNDRDPSIRISVGPAGGDRVEISVADNGPGIPTDTAHALTKRDVTDPRDVPGTVGLGLWLVKWFVDTYDGTIAIADNSPRGTVVQIALPHENATVDQPHTVQTGQTGRRGRTV